MAADSLKLAFRNRGALLCLAASLLFHYITAFIFSSNYKSNPDSVTAFDFTQSLMNLELVLFVLILSASYICYDAVRRSELRNMVTHREYVSQIAIIKILYMLFILLFFTVPTIIVTVFTVKNVFSVDHNLLVHFLKAYFLYYFLYLVLAVEIGELCSHLKKRINAVLVMLLVVLVNSPAALKLYEISIPGSGYAYEVYRWLQCGPRNLYTVVDPVYGISAGFDRYMIVLMWIAVSEFIMLAGGGASLAAKLICGAVIVICAAVNMDQPWVGDEMINSRTVDSDHCYCWYSDNRNQIDDLPDDEFTSVNYKLSLMIRDHLSGRAEISGLGPRDGSEILTLHHQYKVDSVADRSGKSVAYERTGDYIKLNDFQGDSVVISYHGNAAGLYANREWIWLQSQSFFYPVWGKHKIYDVTKNAYTVWDTTDVASEYDITVDAPEKVYCSLPAVKGSHFKGRADTFTLRAGLLDEYKYRNVRVVFPEYDCHSNNSRQITKDMIDSMYETESGSETCYTIDGKTVFTGIESSLYPEYTFYTDHVEASYMNDLYANLYYKSYLRTGKQADSPLRPGEE